MEHYAVIKFCIKVKKSVTETFEMCKIGFGDECFLFSNDYFQMASAFNRRFRIA